MRPACRRRWPRLCIAWRFPPAAGQPHPPRQSRRFLRCHHGNRPNTPMRDRQEVSDESNVALTEHICSNIFRFVWLRLLRHRLTVTSMLMISPSRSCRLQDKKNNDSLIFIRLFNVFTAILYNTIHTGRPHSTPPLKNTVYVHILYIYWRTRDTINEFWNDRDTDFHTSLFKMPIKSPNTYRFSVTTINLNVIKGDLLLTVFIFPLVASQKKKCWH